MTQKNNPYSAVALRVLGPRTAGELVSTIPANLPEGSLCWVSDFAALYRYSAETAAPLASPNVLPAGNPAGTFGRWFKLGGGSDENFASCTGVIENGLVFTTDSTPNTLTPLAPGSLAGPTRTSSYQWTGTNPANSPNFLYSGGPGRFLFTLGATVRNDDSSSPHELIIGALIGIGGGPPAQFVMAIDALPASATSSFSASRVLELPDSFAPSAATVVRLGLGAFADPSVNLTVRSFHFTVVPV